MRVGDLDTGDALLTAEEVAARAGIGHRTLLSYLADTRRGVLVPRPDTRTGGTPLWRETTIAGWLAERAAS